MPIALLQSDSYGVADLAGRSQPGTYGRISTQGGYLEIEQIVMCSGTSGRARNRADRVVRRMHNVY